MGWINQQAVTTPPQHQKACFAHVPTRSTRHTVARAARSLERRGLVHRECVGWYDEHPSRSTNVWLPGPWSVTQQQRAIRALERERDLQALLTNMD